MPKHIVGKCENCGNDCWAFDSHKRRRFCSKQCFYSWRVGKPHSSPRMDLLKICKQCGVEFKAYHKTSKYCSNDCYNAKRRGAKFFCVICGMEITTRYRSRRKYCSKDCTNRRKDRFLLVKCIICGKDFKRTSLQKYEVCRTCKRKSRVERNEHTGASALRILGKKCADCGYDEYPEIIIAHHKDGNRSNTRIANYVPLCPNCHALRHLHNGKYNTRDFLPAQTTRQREVSA